MRCAECFHSFVKDSVKESYRIFHETVKIFGTAHKDLLCLRPARMFYLPFRKVLSYMNTSATVIVGT